MPQHNVKMERNLRFRDILILAFSTMIGWGWVVLTGSWVVTGGALGAVLAFLIGAVLCIFIGMAYCELTPMLPYSGGELVFAYSAMGYDASWFTGWMITFAYIGVAAWEGPALATAIDYLIPIPRYGYLWTVAGFDVYATWLLVPAVMGMVLMIINAKGTRISSLFQMIVTGILALGGIFFCILSGANGNAENAQPIFTSSKGLFTVILAVPAMFVGFDVIPQAAEEMNLPLKKVPKAIVYSIILAATWYIAMILSAAFSAPPSVLGESGISVVNAINYSTNSPVFGKLIVLTAIMGILTSWNGFIIGATRVLYSMGRAKMLPASFGKLSAKNRTPITAIVFVGLISIFSPLLGKNSLGWFVDASAFGTVIAYLMVVISFLVLRYRQPELNRPYKVRHWKLVGFVSVAIALFFIVLYLPFGSSSLLKEEWIIVGVWVVTGLLIYLIERKDRKRYAGVREALMKGTDAGFSQLTGQPVEGTE